MDYIDNIHQFPKQVRLFFLFFTICLSVGYFTGFKFIHKTSGIQPKGIEENYLGNESDLEALDMKFKKPEGEILTTIHTHILSFSMIFFCTGLILISVPLGARLKNFLLIEPFISIAITFSSIWFLWKGFTWVSYVVMVSGMVLTFTYVLTAVLIIKNCFVRKK